MNQVQTPTHETDAQLSLRLVPPPEAYLYFPPSDECKYVLGKQSFRRIFDGQIVLDADDNARVDNFLNQIQQNNVTLDFSLWNRAMVMRFFQANQFNYLKTIQSIRSYEEWLVTLPPQYDLFYEQFLNSGVIYIQGRDCRYRPIIVLNPYKIDLKTIPIEQQLLGLTYFLEAIRAHMLLPGQIENWVIIMDLNYTSVGLPLAALKQVMGYLQNNYRSRLYKMYLVNSSMAVSLVWKGLKPFLEENTGQKIIFAKDKLPELFVHANRAQVEVKFGGTAPTRETYWPPELNQNDIQIESDPIQLMSVDMYKVIHKQGRLVNNKIYEKYIQDDNQKQL